MLPKGSKTSKFGGIAHAGHGDPETGSLSGHEAGSGHGVIDSAAGISNRGIEDIRGNRVGHGGLQKGRMFQGKKSVSNTSDIAAVANNKTGPYGMMEGRLDTGRGSHGIQEAIGTSHASPDSNPYAGIYQGESKGEFNKPPFKMQTDRKYPFNRKGYGID